MEWAFNSEKYIVGKGAIPHRLFCLFVHLKLKWQKCKAETQIGCKLSTTANRVSNLVYYTQSTDRDMS